MTTVEFKQKYPELAHLEGNALWNAMEDKLLSESLSGTGWKPTELEDIEEEIAKYPDNWVVVTTKEGDFTITSYTPKSFIDKIKAAVPEPGTIPKMMWLIPGAGLVPIDSDVNSNEP